MADNDIHCCYVCGKYGTEATMLEYNDRFFCGLPHKLKQERIDDETLRNPPGRAAVIRLIRPG